MSDDRPLFAAVSFFFCLLSALYGIEKDQSLVKRMYMIVFLLPVGFPTIPGHFRW